MLQKQHWTQISSLTCYSASHVRTGQDAILVSPMYSHYVKFNFPTASLIVHAQKHMQQFCARSRNQQAEGRVAVRGAGDPGESVTKVNSNRWWWAVVLGWADEGLCPPPYPLLLLLLSPAVYLPLASYWASVVSASLLR